MLSGKQKEWLDFIISMLALTVVIDLAIIFTLAMLHGIYSGNWDVVVRTNDWGEGYLETCLIWILFVAQIRNIKRQYQDIKKHKEVAEKGL